MTSELGSSDRYTSLRSASGQVAPRRVRPDSEQLRPRGADNHDTAEAPGAVSCQPAGPSKTPSRCALLLPLVAAASRLIRAPLGDARDRGGYRTFLSVCWTGARGWKRAGRQHRVKRPRALLVTPTLHYLRPSHHPESDASTDMAMQYLARSPAARIAEAAPAH